MILPRAGTTSTRTSPRRLQTVGIEPRALDIDPSRAVVVSREYGAALRMLMDLNRFQLYEKIHLRLPTTTASERKLVENLKTLSSEPASTATGFLQAPHAISQHRAAGTQCHLASA